MKVRFGPFESSSDQILKCVIKRAARCCLGDTFGKVFTDVGATFRLVKMMVWTWLFG